MMIIINKQLDKIKAYWTSLPGAVPGFPLTSCVTRAVFGCHPVLHHPLALKSTNDEMHRDS
eukprot:m.104299 g.104299  ORF g.104299 m.104299 type:complete len:61 (+) comp13840_c0_seq3:2516-2698(+)